MKKPEDRTYPCEVTLSTELLSDGDGDDLPEWMKAEIEATTRWIEKNIEPDGEK